jgi:hypothetical protein
VLPHRLLALLFLLIGAGYLFEATQIPMDPWTAAETVNTRTLPLLYGSLLCLVSLALLFRPAGTRPEGLDGYRVLRLIGVLVLVLGFVLALPYVPLWIALGVLLAALPLWLGQRSAVQIGLLAIGVPLIGWLGVEVLLGLYLPD